MNTAHLWLVCIALGILDVVLMLWTPSGNGYKSPWAVPLVSGFLLLLLIPLLLDLLNRSLGRRMQAKETATSGEVITKAEERPPMIEEVPVPAFALEVITTENIPAVSPLVERARDLYRERLRIDRQAVWFLIASHLVIASLGWASGVAYPLPSFVVIGFLATFVALMVVVPPGKVRLILVPLLWRTLSWAGVLITAVLAVIYVAKGTALSVVAIAAVAGHFLRTIRRNQQFRRRVMAQPPLRLLFLWVFDSLSPAFLFLGFAAAWRFLGTIRLLNGAGFMGDSIDIAKSFARGKSANLIVGTPEELSERLRAFDDSPRAMAMYPHHTLLCNDAVWKSALQNLLDGADVVLMDLRGFSRSHRGAAYELRELIDGFPTSRFVLLADDSTDIEFLTETLRAAWSSMAIDSPNRRASAPVRLYRFSRGVGSGDPFPDLLSIAREGDRLFELVCASVTAEVGSALPAKSVG